MLAADGPPLLGKHADEELFGEVTYHVKALSNDEVEVHAAFPGEQGPASGDDFVLVKRDSRWHILNTTNT
jgi:hypothetical protein